MTGVLTLLAATAFWLLILVYFSPWERAWKGHFGRLFVRLPLARSLYRAEPSLLWVCWWMLLVLLSDAVSHTTTWAFLIDAARRLDDYFNYDDDSFRRFFTGVRNRVKWKMKLPQTSV